MHQIRLLLTFLFFVASNSVGAQTWTAMGTGVNDQVNSLAVLNGELYVAGKFSTAGGTSANRVAKWNGTGWSVLGAGIPNTEVYSLAVYNNELYASYYGGTIYKWNGISWVTIPSLAGSGSQIPAMTVYNGELYAGGEAIISSFNGATWTNTFNVGVIGGPIWPRVYSFAVYNGELYAGGDFTSVNGVAANHIAKWNGTTWSAVGLGVTTPSKVSAMAVYNGDLYVAGTFSGAGGVTSPSIAKWNGTTWSAVGTGLNGPATALHVFNGNLYVGGFFTSAGPMAVSSFATWNGTTWLPSSGGLNNYVRALTDFNGQVIAGGNFTNITGSDNIAAFTQCTSPPPPPGIVFGNSNPCSGGTQLYYIGPIVPGTSYTWTLPIGWTGSSSTNSISATPAAGSGSVMVSATNACGSSAPISLPVVVLPTPSNSITTSGPLTFCEGASSVTLSVANAAGNTYQWRNVGTPIPGATNYFYIPTTSGSYTVTVTAGPCSTLSPPIPISILPSPIAPTVTQTGNILTASPSQLPYQWYRNGNPITNATNAVYTATLSGTYYVVITDVNGCTAQSAPIVFTLAGIEDPDGSNRFHLFPNPNNGVFAVRHSARPINGVVTIEIRDVSGKVVFSDDKSSGGTEIEKQIDVTNLSAGVYTLRIITEHSCWTELFMKK